MASKPPRAPAQTPTEDALELCYLTAVQALDRFRDGSLKPSDLLAALIARIEAVNPLINALTDTYFEQARAQALLADRAYAQGQASGAMQGLPILVKDAQRVQGQRTTYGSLLHMDDGPETVSDPMVERMLAAGAIILARTTTPEYCISGVCRSRAWGTTVNPFNRAFGPGGSSGGSGAALAAGFAPLGTGTDIGGSIRIPASCCGVVGYKAPHGRFPDGPPANFDRYNHCGPMARSVGDIALVHVVIAGAHPRDHDSLREVVDLPAAPGPGDDLKGLRVAYSIDLGYRPIDPEVRANTLAALDQFRALGAEVEEVAVPWSKDCDDAAMIWYNSMHYLRQTVWAADRAPEKLCDYTLFTADIVRKAQLEELCTSWDVQHSMYQFFGALMEDFDIFVCPTLAVPAVAADHDPTDTSYSIDGQQLDPEYGWVLAHHFNMLHHCPVMAVPSGRAANGVPTGLQIVGRTFDDATVYTAAYAFEAACGGWINAPDKRPVLASGS